MFEGSKEVCCQVHRFDVVQQIMKSFGGVVSILIFAIGTLTENILQRVSNALGDSRPGEDGAPFKNFE